MEKKETTPRRVARRSYEERNKDKLEHWIDLISKNWNYSGNLFYEVDFIGDGFGENAFYCIPSTENPFA